MWPKIELWNTWTRNPFDTFASEDDARAVLRQLMHDHGRAHGTRFALGQEDATGASRLLTTGEDLLQLAERRANTAAQ